MEEEGGLVPGHEEAQVGGRLPAQPPLQLEGGGPAREQPVSGTALSTLHTHLVWERLEGGPYGVAAAELG